MYYGKFCVSGFSGCDVNESGFAIASDIRLLYCVDVISATRGLTEVHNLYKNAVGANYYRCVFRSSRSQSSSKKLYMFYG